MNEEISRLKEENYKLREFVTAEDIEHVLDQSTHSLDITEEKSKKTEALQKGRCVH